MYLCRRSGGMPAPRHREVFDPDRIVVVVAVHRHRGRDADRIRRRRRLRACDDLFVACARPAPGRETTAVGIEMRSVNTFSGCWNPGGTLRIADERAHHQARRDEQDRGQRHLRDDERIARAVTLAAFARAARAVLQRRGHLRPRVLQDRDRAEQQAGDHRDREREEQHHRIDRDFVQPRQLRRLQVEQQLDAAIRQRRRRARRRSPRPAATPDINCQATCRASAPSASRMASSCWRASARTRNRLATFAQATSRTRPTVPSRIHSMSPMSPTASIVERPHVRAKLRLVEHLLRQALRHREALVSDGSRRSTSALAWRCVTPGLSRARPW